jgi:hypothetical protein
VLSCHPELAKDLRLHGRVRFALDDARNKNKAAISGGFRFFRPFEALAFPFGLPKAYALGYILSPLRGSNLLHKANPATQLVVFAGALPRHQFADCGAAGARYWLLIGLDFGAGSFFTYRFDA